MSNINNFGYDHDIDHTDIKRGISTGRKLRSLAFHAAIATARAGIKGLLKADRRSRHLHEIRNLSPERLRDVGLTEADIHRVRIMRGDLPF